MGRPCSQLRRVAGGNPNFVANLSLTQSDLPAYLAHVDLRHVHCGDTDPAALAARPRYRFF